MSDTPRPADMPEFIQAALEDGRVPVHQLKEEWQAWWKARTPGGGTPSPEFRGRKTKRRTPEADFQRQVVELARLHGWKVAWFRPVRVQRANGEVYHETPVGADGKGWPDLILVRPPVIVAAELKAGSSLSPEQRSWAALLLAAGVPTFVWRPKDWPAIETLLRDGLPRRT